MVNAAISGGVCFLFAIWVIANLWRGWKRKEFGWTKRRREAATWALSDCAYLGLWYYYTFTPMGVDPQLHSGVVQISKWAGVPAFLALLGFSVWYWIVADIRAAAEQNVVRLAVVDGVAHVPVKLVGKPVQTQCGSPIDRVDGVCTPRQAHEQHGVRVCTRCLDNKADEDAVH